MPAHVCRRGAARAKKLGDYRPERLSAPLLAPLEGLSANKLTQVILCAPAAYASPFLAHRGYFRSIARLE